MEAIVPTETELGEMMLNELRFYKLILLFLYLLLLTLSIVIRTNLENG